MRRAGVVPSTVTTNGSTRTARRRPSRTDPDHTLPTQTPHMPMMHPEDEANGDAPLVPQVQTPNRPTMTDGGDAESIRREIRELRSRIDDLEADLDRRGEY